MRWEQLFADLEAQFEAESDSQQSDVAELIRAEWASITLLQRLHANRGERLTWWRPHGPAFPAVLCETGRDWILIEGARGRSLVPIWAVAAVGGLRPGAQVDDAALAGALPLRVVLRGLARDRAPVMLDLTGDRSLTGTIDRVGADQLDLAVHELDQPRRRASVREVVTVALPGLTGVTTR